MSYTVTCIICGAEYCSNVPDNGGFLCNEHAFINYTTMTEEEYREFCKEVKR